MALVDRSSRRTMYVEEEEEIKMESASFVIILLGTKAIFGTILPGSHESGLQK